jgi:uncharacterized membrane protein YedE/YeeE
MMRRHFNLVSQYLIGLLFGFGLILSGMSNPQKVLDFLDITGQWDPSLLFVMGGAVIVGLAGFYLVTRRTEAFFSGALHLPKRKEITRPLVLGSLIFGVGWGIAGFCPGPVLVAMGSGSFKAFVFVIFMLLGMAFCNRFCTAHKQ